MEFWRLENMKLEETIDYNKMSVKEKKKQMLEKELETLKSFYDRNAITKENYDKGVAAVKKELEAVERE